MASYIKLLIIDDKMYTFINAHMPLLPQTQFLTTKKQTLLNSQFPKDYSPPLLLIHHLYSYIVWEILIPNLTIMIDCMGSSIIHKKINFYWHWCLWKGIFFDKIGVFMFFFWQKWYFLNLFGQFLPICYQFLSNPGTRPLRMLCLVIAPTKII